MKLGPYLGRRLLDLVNYLAILPADAGYLESCLAGHQDTSIAGLTATTSVEGGAVQDNRIVYQFGDMGLKFSGVTVNEKKQFGQVSLGEIVLDPAGKTGGSPSIITN